MNKSNTLLKGMFYVLMANIINMIFNLVTNFILPKYLSVDSYAAIKTYQLYISYIGALHFGFTDGMYLKYGGKRLSELPKRELSSNLGTLRILLIIMSTLFIVFSIVSHNTILLFFSMAIVPINMANYFTSLYQATGEFNKYGKIINIIASSNCLINAVLIFGFHIDNYSFYLISYIIVNIVIWLFLEMGLYKNSDTKNSFSTFSFAELFENCKSGILLMLGNLSSFILTGLDRWFVKFLMSTTSFAFYSFAVSMESFLNVAMNPITVTLYNYFCNHEKKEDILQVRNLVLIFATIIIAVAFPAKFILEHFLIKYFESSMVMFILFATQLFSMLNKGIYINLYKAKRMQRKYFIKLIIVIISGVVFNFICFAIRPVMESFAVGTLLSSILWFILNKTDFQEVTYRISEYIYIGLTLCVFIICGYFFESIIGFLIYITYVIIAAFVFEKKEVIFIKNTYIIPLVKRIFKRQRTYN